MPRRSSSTAASAGKSSTLGRRGAATTVAAASGVRVTSRSPWRPSGPSLTVSTETWERATALRPAEAADQERARRRALIAAAHPALREGPAAELVLAADSFIVAPPRRELRAIAVVGDPFRTVIAGYHWFTDWGRDTMISLEGLTLVTGRQNELAASSAISPPTSVTA